MLHTLEQEIIGHLHLDEWQAADHDQKKSIMQGLFQLAKDAFQLDIQLLFSMPFGFEAAYGLADPVTGDIRVNEAKWPACDPIEPLYYFLHELRHAIQSARPELFPRGIEINSRYMIQFDGVGYKVDGDDVITVKLEGSRGYFTDLYLASPSERDANLFAYRCLKAAGASGRLEQIHAMWTPKFHYFTEENAPDEFMKTVSEIERLSNEKRA